MLHPLGQEVKIKTQCPKSKSQPSKTEQTPAAAHGIKLLSNLWLPEFCNNAKNDCNGGARIQEALVKTKVCALVPNKNE
jgi:hypothetical protein